MFLQKVASGLVFASGAGLSRLGVTGESWVLLGLGLAAAVAGVSWFAAIGPGVRPA